MTPKLRLKWSRDGEERTLFGLRRRRRIAYWPPPGRVPFRTLIGTLEKERTKSIKMQIWGEDVTPQGAKCPHLGPHGAPKASLLVNNSETFSGTASKRVPGGSRGGFGSPF